MRQRWRRSANWKGIDFKIYGFSIDKVWMCSKLPQKSWASRRSTKGILTQIYAFVKSPDNTSLIFMVAIGPSMVVIALMFIVRQVRGHRQPVIDNSD
ncbi:hypothetical protein L2E82_33364 [Cichorium intybus]|uniref:Uncharacterized protein n=1 Tax=Cichorium intybus TaxID=13427 RepID=A0ACB9BJZ1_CICIN|nr:hypothetical protein L2E82_33364 [Cichorium intybus]